MLFNALYACDFVHILCSFFFKMLWYILISLQIIGSPGWWGSDSSSSSGKSGKSGSGSGKSGKSGGYSSSSSSGDWGK